MPTPIYDMAEMIQSQANPHVIFNEAIRKLEVIAGKVAASFSSAPPGTPAEGDVVVVGAAATGAFVGREYDIAYYSGGAWLFINAQVGEIWAIGSSWYRLTSVSGWVAITINAGGNAGVGSLALTGQPATITDVA